MNRWVVIIIVAIVFLAIGYMVGSKMGKKAALKAVNGGAAPAATEETKAAA